MVPRKRKRVIEFPIKELIFRPRNPKGEVVLESDEIEAIRLIGIEKRKQKEAARIMEVSQPTFSRIISKAIEKIADAFINEKTIRFVTKLKPLTKVYFCRECGSLWVPPMDFEPDSCPFCGSKKTGVVDYESACNIRRKKP